MGHSTSLVQAKDVEDPVGEMTINIILLTKDRNEYVNLDPVHVPIVANAE